MEKGAGIDSNSLVEEKAVNVESTLNHHKNSSESSENNKENLIKASSNEDEIYTEIPIKKSDKKGWERFFSKIEPGSIRASIFSLSILSIGTGCLSLPQRFAQMSVLLCSFEIVLAGIAAYWTLNLMVIASRKCDLKEYSKVINHICGPKWSVFLDVTMVIYLFGVLIIYQIIIYKMIGAFVYEVGHWPDYEKLDDFYKHSLWGEIWFKITVMISTSLVMILPLNLLKDVTKLRFTSIFGIFCLLIVAIIIIIQLPSYLSDYWENKYDPNNEETWINWYNLGTAFTSDLFFFKGTATLFYAYSCHIGAFPVYEKIAFNSEQRTNKVFLRSIILDACFYLTVGITGYLTQPINTPSIIIERNSLNGGNDVVMTIGRILIIILLCAKIPANYNSLRLSIFELIWGNTDITNSRNLLITIPVTVVTALIGAIYSDVADFISLLGGFCSVVVVFFFPGYIYIKSNEYPFKHWKNISTLIICTLMSLIGIISGILSIITMTKGEKTGH